MQTQPREEVERRPRNVWWIVGVTVVVVALIGFGTWVIVAANQPDDIDIATDVVDEWLAALDAYDPEAIVGVFTEDGRFIDGDGESWVGSDQIRAHAYHHARLITIAVRTGELAATEAGTFTFPMHGETTESWQWDGVVEVELDGDLASRIEFLETTVALLDE
jgi:ketosteroid isomerase-like protein